MSAQPNVQVTAAEYLKFDHQSDQKYEYDDGQIYLMAGATPRHNLISASVNFTLYAQLRGKGCFIYSGDMRIKVEKTGLYTYPDMTIVCGQPQYEDTKPPTLLNPTVIIEILSPSTERDDRGKKFQHYRNLDSLQEYILISQSGYRIEKFTKQTDKVWLFREAVGRYETLILSSLNCQLALSEVYDQISFDGDA